MRSERDAIGRLTVRVEELEERIRELREAVDRFTAGAPAPAAKAAKPAEKPAAKPARKKTEKAAKAE